MNRTVGEMIAAYRKKAGLSQAELADRLAAENIHISGKTISTAGRKTVLNQCAVFLPVPDFEIRIVLKNSSETIPETQWPYSMIWGNRESTLINFLVHPVSYRKEPDVLPTEKTADIAVAYKKYS